MKVVAAATATAMALQPLISSAARRGVELATDLEREVESAILKCTRRAEREGNAHYFKGASPTREQCAALKREGQTWAMFLGTFKHVLAWDCLHAELEGVIPLRYRFEPRFRFNESTGTWEFLAPEAVDQLVASLGWKGLEGTIAPDIVIMDADGVIIRVYDMKFPCPYSNDATWPRYTKGRWELFTQQELYQQALRVKPRLVSPRSGVLGP